MADTAAVPPDAARLIAQGRADYAEALAAYDALAPASIDFMLGRWKGSGLHTGDPMDGLLEAYGWYGKVFENAETVHPLIFSDGRGGVMPLEPRHMRIGLAHVGFAKHPLTVRAFRLLRPLLRARGSAARLRMTEFRGKSCATMIYDSLPINDVFRRVNDDLVLGAMDLKGSERPFFFVLQRER
jgi:hypothetical protein